MKNINYYKYISHSSTLTLLLLFGRSLFRNSALRPPSLTDYFVIFLTIARQMPR
jgi:hypothetical protein